MSPSVVAEGLTFAYANGQVVLDGVSVVGEASTLTCVTGKSGAGKSTLLYCLAGVLPASGRIELMGQALSAKPAQRAALRLAHCGFIFQRGELLPELSVVENVALPLRLSGAGRVAAVEAAMSFLERLGIASCADRTPDEISGGQAQRASVARALIHRPSIVFADEPTASLDTVSRDAVIATLMSSLRDGAAIVCATHDPVLMDAAQARLELREGVRAAGIRS